MNSMPTNRIVEATGVASGKSDASAKAGASIRSSAPQAKHPLDPAFARINRADDHLRALADKVEKRSLAQIDAFSLLPNPEQPRSIKLDFGAAVALPLDFIFGILVGEICYNLRAALDYLVYELAILDSGSIQRTQFPIDPSPAVFNARTNRGFLQGVSSAHVEKIEKLQPYMNCAWTQKLQDISNPDKHRTLRGITGQHGVKVDVNDDRALLETGAGILRCATTADGTTMFVRFEMQTALFFDDGLAVISELNKIRDETEKTLADFKSEFP
jgi:hypothetical protein